MDGQAVNAGILEIIGDTATVKVGQALIQSQLDAATDNMSIIIPAGTGIAVAAFVLMNVDDMAAKEMTLTIQFGNIHYVMSTTAIDTAAILSALSANSLADMPISITVTTCTYRCKQRNALCCRAGERK